MKKIYIGGVSGCGKTTVSELFKIKHKNFLHLSTSEEIMKQGKISTREELLSMSGEKLEKLRKEVFLPFYRKNKNIIVDGHYFLDQEDINYFDVFILIEIRFNKLIELRKIDPNHYRSNNIDDIKNEIKQMKDRVNQLENSFGIKIKKIYNDGSLEKLGGDIENILIEIDDC